MGMEIVRARAVRSFIVEMWEFGFGDSVGWWFWLLVLLCGEAASVSVYILLERKEKGLGKALI